MSTGTATVTASSLNVRKNAGTQYAAIGSLAKGKTVSYYGEKNGWLEIKYNGQTGYISKQYTTTNASSSGAGTAAPASGGSVDATLTSAQITAAVNYNKKNCQALCTQIQKLVGVTADGIFGPQTVKAIAAWQARNGLTVDGQFGPASQAKANFGGGSKPAEPETKPETPSTTTDGGSTKKLLTDSQVQAAIRYNQNNCPGIAVEIQKLVGVTADGDIGPQTVQAIAAWQKANGLTVDGQFGPASQAKSGIKPKVNDTVRNGSLNAHTVNYKQYADPWGPKMYSNHGDRSQTYRSSACGPTAVANVIATKVNRSVTPETLGNYALQNGYRTYNDGTAHAFVPAVAKAYGLTATSCTVSTGVKKMQEGHYCVAAMGAGYWTTGGHYITPYASDGSTIYVDDPGHSSRPNGFKQGVSQFSRECHAMWYFS